jgi:carbonic anhydrase
MLGAGLRQVNHTKLAKKHGLIVVHSHRKKLSLRRPAACATSASAIQCSATYQNLCGEPMRNVGKFAKGAIWLLMICVVSVWAQEHWSYGGKTGPDEWGKLSPEYAACKTGKQQSPIDIKHAKASDLPAIQFDYKPAPLHIINNGHTIQINYPPGSSITVGDKKYELKQFHFHHPSENKINGRAFNMEAHFVHADTNGNLAVVAVMLKPGAGNSLLATLWAHVPRDPGPEQKYEDVQINAAALLPADHGYYTFPGSLTTPPCSENVTWMVLKTPENLTQAQSDTFGAIYAENARPVEKLNDRQVLESH